MKKNKIAASSTLEEVINNKEMYPFPSMLNFRFLVGKDAEEDIKAKDATATKSGEEVSKEPKQPSIVKVYRSSRPDFLTEDELGQFLARNINGIIDLRAHTEYKRSNPKKLIDLYYHLYKVKLPIFHKYKADDSVKIGLVKLAQVTMDPPRRHYVIDFFGLNYLWMIATGLPKVLRFLAILYVPIDILLLNKNFFVGLLSKKKHMLQTYIDIVQRCGAPMCAGLKLLCDPQNIPAMINCAYGKDRTGILSALILSCLGYSREYICNDYAQSIVQMEPLFTKEEKEKIDVFNQTNNFHHANFRVMELTLEFIDEKYGGVSSYLESIGFYFEDQQKLRKTLLE